MRVDGVIVAFELVPPYRVEKLFAGKRFSRMGGEEEQEIEFLRGKLDLFSRDAHLSQFTIDGEMAEPDFAGSDRGCRLRFHCFDAPEDGFRWAMNSRIPNGLVR